MKRDSKTRPNYYEHKPTSDPYTTNSYMIQRTFFCHCVLNVVKVLLEKVNNKRYSVKDTMPII